MKRMAMLVSSLAALNTGCTDELPPEGQFVLHVTTDAPVPSGRGLALPDEPIPLFDAVRFDFYLPDGSIPCSRCSRAFGVDEQMFADDGVSIGIVPTDRHVPGIVRVRMYLAEVELGEEPSAAGSLDAWVELPTIDDEGVVDLTVVLGTDNVGRPAGSLADPIAAAPGQPPAPDLVGSWPHAKRIDCADLHGPNQACVRGGAFWMGHPKFLAVPTPGWDSDERRIVVLDPFFIDRTEVTVAEFRASGLAGTTVPGDPIAWNGEKPQFFEERMFTEPTFCTFTPSASERDALPVTCVSRELAANYCEAKNATLPTEAQLEYLMGGRLGTAYAWGRQEPTCDMAVWGRAFLGQSAGDGSCRIPIDPAEAAGPRPPGSGTADRVLFGDVPVFDLTGNVSEWARDAWNRQDESCWPTGVVFNPMCTKESNIDDASAPCKGGNWTESPALLHAAKRWSLKDENESLFDLAQIGFRCASEDAGR